MTRLLHLFDAFCSDTCRKNPPSSNWILDFSKNDRLGLGSLGLASGRFSGSLIRLGLATWLDRLFLCRISRFFLLHPAIDAIGTRANDPHVAIVSAHAMTGGIERGRISGTGSVFASRHGRRHG